MNTTLKKLLTGALIAGTALALGGCKDKNKTSGDSEQLAKSDQTNRPTGATNDRTDEANKNGLAQPTTPPPVAGTVPSPEPGIAAATPEGNANANPNPEGPTGNAAALTPPGERTPQADDELDTRGTPGSPEIAHTGPQGSAVAPNTDLPPDNTLAGTNNPTGASSTNDQARGMEISRSTAFNQQKDALNKAENKELKPSDANDPQARREAAYGLAAERLAKLDARVSDLRAKVDAMADNAAFTDTMADLRKLHETAQSSIDQIRDTNVKLDAAREAADRQMTQFEAAINSVQKRVEKAASQT